MRASINRAVCFATFAFCMVLCCQPTKQLFLHICSNANCVALIWKNKSSRSREPAIENEARSLLKLQIPRNQRSHEFCIPNSELRAHAKRNPHSHEAAAKWNRTRSNLKLVCQVVAPRHPRMTFPLAWVDATRVWFLQHQHLQQSSTEISVI
jgi:hypothetical protein